MLVAYRVQDFIKKGKQTHVKTNALLHKAQEDCYDKRTKCRRGGSGYYGKQLTTGQWSFRAPKDWHPVYDEKKDVSVEEQVAAFLRGDKLIPEWAYESRFCVKCWAPNWKWKRCDMGEKHKDFEVAHERAG